MIYNVSVIPRDSLYAIFLPENITRLQVHLAAGKRITKMRLLKRPVVVAAFGDSCSCLHFWSHFWSPWSVSFTLSWTNEKRHITKEERPTIWSPHYHLCIHKSEKKIEFEVKYAYFSKIYHYTTDRWANFLSLQKVWMSILDAFRRVSIDFLRKMTEREKTWKVKRAYFLMKKSNWFSWSKLVHEHDSSLFQFVVMQNLKIKSILDAWMCPVLQQYQKIAVEGRC